MPSSADVVIVLDRFSRWKVIANRCASSRTRCSRYSPSDVRGRIVGYSLARQPDLLQPLGQPDQRDVVDAEVVEHRLRRGRPAARRRRRRPGSAGRRTSAAGRWSGRCRAAAVVRALRRRGRSRRRRPRRPARRGSGRSGGGSPRRSSRCRRCPRAWRTGGTRSCGPARPRTPPCDATTLVPCTWLMSKHSMRSGALRQVERLLQFAERPRAGGQVGGALELVLVQRLRGVAGDGLGQRALVAALRHPQLHPRAAPLARATRRARRRRRAGPGRAPRAGSSEPSSSNSAVELGARTARRGRRSSSRPACRRPSRAGRAPGRRGRGTPAPRPRGRPRRTRPRRRRCRRRTPRPASPSPGAARSRSSRSRAASSNSRFGAGLGHLLLEAAHHRGRSCRP